MPTSPLAGGAYIAHHVQADQIFTPEQYTEEQRNILELCQDFVQTAIQPKLEDIDRGGYALVEGLLEAAGELGLLGVGISEAYGGMGLDVITQMLVQEGLGHSHSFATAFAAHTGIGTYPIQYFGTESQKTSYLPGIASGQIKPCYNLTEPNAGSDAMSGKTSARLSEDGQHYVINGQKCWITNSGFADIFIVFARELDHGISAFIVPSGTEGLSLGDEEHKMGIKGSSTRQVFFADVKVPLENLIGERGRGHKIAFNALNIGRIKLGAASLGAARYAYQLARDYAQEREQFGQAIIEFGAIQFKLAEMRRRIYSLEAAIYRAAGDIQATEEALLAAGQSRKEALLGAAEQYAIECAMTKVYGSEVLDYCVDEGVQIHGGNGFSAEYPIERCYRDARITRIYEGTSEINRLLTVQTLVKRVMAGELDLNAPPSAAISQPEQAYPGPLGPWRASLERCKHATLTLLGAAAQKFGAGLRQQQMIILPLADMMIELYHAESALLRTEQLLASGAAAEDEVAMTQLSIHEMAAGVQKAGRELLPALFEADEVTEELERLNRWTAVPLLKVWEARSSLVPNGN